MDQLGIGDNWLGKQGACTAVESSCAAASARSNWLAALQYSPVILLAHVPHSPFGLIQAADRLQSKFAGTNRSGVVLGFCDRPPRLTPIPVNPFAYPLVSFYIKEVHTEPAANESLEVL